MACFLSACWTQFSMHAIGEPASEGCTWGHINRASAHTESALCILRVVCLSCCPGSDLDNLEPSERIACCRFLRPGGAVLPDLAAMHVAGAGCGALDLDFWTDVHGFSFRFSTLLLSLTDRGPILISGQCHAAWPHTHVPRLTPGPHSLEVIIFAWTLERARELTGIVTAWPVRLLRESTSSNCTWG